MSRGLELFVLGLIQWDRFRGSSESHEKGFT